MNLRRQPPVSQGTEGPVDHEPNVRPIVDEGLGNSSYLVEVAEGRALVVDPSRDPLPYLRAAAAWDLRIAWVAETHLHADFVSGARELVQTGATVLAAQGACLAFPHRGLSDDQEVDLGGLGLRALATPGHTPEHLSLLLLDGAAPAAVFTGGAEGCIYSDPRHDQQVSLGPFGCPEPRGRAQETSRRHCYIGCGGTASGRLPSMRSLRHLRPQLAPRSAFAGYRFPPEVITLAVRWYLRFGLSYRDVEELLAERGIEVDHVSIYRWVQRFAPEFAEAARARRHVVGDRWNVDETYLRVGGTWRYLFRAIDQFGQVIDVFLSPRRDAQAARGFFERAIDRTRISPVEVTTDRYRVYPRVLDELVPAAFHGTEVHANNPIETDHGRLKARLRPMRGLKRDRSARVIVAGHAFVQNLRRGFYDLGTDGPPAAARLADAFAELALVI